MDHKLKSSHKTIKMFKKRRKCLGLDNGFSDRLVKVQSIKEKANKFAFIKVNFYSEKCSVKRMEKQATEWGKNTCKIKGPVSAIYKEHSKLNSEKQSN